MTIKEAFGNIACGLLSNPNDYSIEINFLAEQLEKVEQAEKYKYHDLRKNPNDLPTEYKVFACIQGITDVYYETIYYGKPYGVYPEPKGKVFFCSDSEYGDYVLDNVVAWKYIEPFESEDEE